MAIERGVMPDVDAREPWFLCYEHTDKDIDETLQVYADLVKDGEARVCAEPNRSWSQRSGARHGSKPHQTERR